MGGRLIGCSAKTHAQKRLHMLVFGFVKVVHHVYVKVVDADVVNLFLSWSGLFCEMRFVQFVAEENFFTSMFGGIQIESQAIANLLVQPELFLDRTDRLRKTNLKIAL